jgi:hypothetical protein
MWFGHSYWHHSTYHLILIIFKFGNSSKFAKSFFVHLHWAISKNLSEIISNLQIYCKYFLSLHYWLYKVISHFLQEKLCAILRPGHNVINTFYLQFMKSCNEQECLSLASFSCFLKQTHLLRTKINKLQTIFLITLSPGYKLPVTSRQ